MIGGWIKIFKKFEEWEWYTDSKTVHLFIHCLLKANYEKKRWKGVEVKRGQFITSLESLSKDTNISVRSIRTCLSRLEETGEIDKKTDKRFTIVTVCKYELYQQINPEATQSPTNERQTSDKRATTTKEDKNNKKRERVKVTPPTLDEIKKYIEEKTGRNDIQVFRQAEKFFNFYDSKGWKVGKVKMSNWKSACTRSLDWDNAPIKIIAQKKSYNPFQEQKRNERAN